MKTARTLGISKRRFEGWEPATTYHSDDTGRLLFSVPESEWSDLEQGWMLALGMLEAETCEGCGGDLRETLVHEAEEWDLLGPVRCGKCTRIGMQQDAYLENKANRQMQALRWGAELRKKRGTP